MLRKVEFRIPSNRREACSTEFLIKDPSEQEFESHMVESKLLEIDELTNGDCFGDYASILKEPIRYSVVTQIPVEAFACHISDFILLGRNFAEAFLKFSKVIPEDTDLRKALVEMQKWNMYKNEVMRSVKADQVNTRQDFNR